MGFVKILNNVNQAGLPTDYAKLISEIKSQCIWSHNEDPPEEFFTENILFKNGNNVVYPGINTQGTEIVQDLIDSFSGIRTLPDEFVAEATLGVIFILEIHNAIARKLGHTHRMYTESKDNALYSPPNDQVIALKEIFFFSFFELKSLCEQIGIPYNTIDQFVYKFQEQKIKLQDPNENPLLKKPFILQERDSY